MHTEPTAAEPTSPSLRVLVVDDSQLSAQTMGWMLESIGHAPTLAYSGSEALAKARELKPDAILLDIGLPDMDGYEVCRTLRGDPALHRATLIAQTGWTQAQHRKEAELAGFHHYLVKPVKLEELQRLLATIVAT